MKKFDAANILDTIEVFGEEKVNKILSDFSCVKNREIEIFVKKNAIEFAKKKMSVTYLVFDADMKLVAIFTLTHKAVQICNEGLSKTARKKIKRFAELDENTNTFDVSAFLIAQFGKNSSYSGEKITGDELMTTTEEMLVAAQRIVGGGVVYLECEDNEFLLNFYQSEENGYQIFNDRYSLIDNTKYIQLFKFI